MSNEITITISGKTGTGKTALVSAIRDVLWREVPGLKLEIDDEDAPLDPAETRKRLAAMDAAGTTVTITTESLRTPGLAGSTLHVIGPDGKRREVK